MSSSASAAFVMVYGGPTWDQSTQSGYRNAYTAPGPGGVIAGNGVAVAAVLKDGPNGVSRGTRAVRWDASGSPAIELGNLGTSIDGFANGGAGAVNTHGTVVGQVEKYNAAGTSLGYRAVRWNATGTVATELGNLGTDSSGYAVTGGAGAINDAGTAAGGASRYSAAGTFLGHRAVRWDASGTAATELDHLGTNASGFTAGRATASTGTR